MQVINIELEEKIDSELSVTYRDETTNLPIDLTGYTALLQVRGGFGSPYVLLELTDANGGVILGGPTGNIDIKFTSNMTDPDGQAYGWDKGVYDLVLTNPFNERIKLLKGFVTLLRSSSL